VSDVDELRAEIARTYGLGANALPFLTATDVDGIEAQAQALAALGASSEQEPESLQPETLADVITRSLAEKQLRKARVVAALHPRQQRRDAGGRFAASGGGFDGGARDPGPLPGPPPAEAHDAAIVELARLRKVTGGGGW
jgi:hypothetical protein